MISARHTMASFYVLSFRAHARNAIQDDIMM
jgi:hypothetical protein